MYGMLSLSFNQTEQIKYKPSGQHMVNYWVYHFTQQTVTVLQNKYAEYPKPHINNNHSLKVQITELDSIRHIIVVSGTHLDEEREPKTLSHAETQLEPRELEQHSKPIEIQGTRHTFALFSLSFCPDKQTRFMILNRNKWVTRLNNAVPPLLLLPACQPPTNTTLQWMESGPCLTQQKPFG